MSTATATQPQVQQADNINLGGILCPAEPTSVHAFMKMNNFTQVARMVRANKNGYPYVTFINAENQAENVYLSKRAAETVTEGQEIGKGFFDGFQCRLAENEAGEKRVKLIVQGDGGGRLDLSDLF